MNVDTARDDLAYLKSLAVPADDFSRLFGQTYFAAGLCYGTQILLHGAQFAGWITGAPAGLAIGLGPTLVLFAILWWLNRGRGARPTLANRTIGGVFTAAGIANLVLMVVIGIVAWRRQSWETWLLYPCAVVVLQGAAWQIASVVRQRAWFLAVALGWFATGIAMAVVISNIPLYLAILGLGFLACMLIPGVLMMRARPEAAR